MVARARRATAKVMYCALSPLAVATAPRPPSRLATRSSNDGDGRVGEAAVDVAVLLQGEAGRGVRGVVEDERARLVDRQRAGAGHRVGDVARVDRPRAEAVLAICHAPTLAAARHAETQEVTGRRSRGLQPAGDPVVRPDEVPRHLHRRPHRVPVDRTARQHDDDRYTPTQIAAAPASIGRRSACRAPTRSRRPAPSPCRARRRSCRTGTPSGRRTSATAGTPPRRRSGRSRTPTRGAGSRARAAPRAATTAAYQMNGFAMPVIASPQRFAAAAVLAGVRADVVHRRRALHQRARAAGSPGTSAACAAPMLKRVDLRLVVPPVLQAVRHPGEQPGPALARPRSSQLRSQPSFDTNQPVHDAT